MLVSRLLNEIVKCTDLFFCFFFCAPRVKINTSVWIGKRKDLEFTFFHFVICFLEVTIATKVSYNVHLLLISNDNYLLHKFLNLFFSRSV